jgi:SAM-dependent methyltransferase
VLSTGAQQYFDTRLSFDPGRAAVWRALCRHLQAEIGAQSRLLELGPGYGDFINQIGAAKKYAVDMREAPRKLAAEVSFFQCSALAIPLPEASVDVVFASNFLEHFDDAELGELFGQIRKVLAPGGKLILLQPNYYYAFREYWDDYTHKKAFSHRSIGDFLAAQGFESTRIEPRFLPFSFKSRLPKSYWLTSLYLKLPWRPFARQMLVVAQRGGARVR